MKRDVLLLLCLLAFQPAPVAAQEGAARGPVRPAVGFPGPPAVLPTRPPAPPVAARGGLPPRLRSVAGSRAPGSGPPGPATRTAPELRVGRAAVLAGLGGGLLLAGELVAVDTRPVPPSGLDPVEIGWARDRRAVAAPVQRGRLAASDWTLKSALALPVAVEFAFGPGGEGRLSRLVRSGVVYSEALALTAGVTWLGKSWLSRPRPYAYRAERPGPGDAYDPTLERAFRSMPSGHAALAWTGASTALTAYLLDRREAPGWERVGAGILAGGVATATSLFRVQAGQHFPSDVLAGSALGVASGITVPLLHRDGRPLPSASALLETVGGTVLGSLVVLVLF